MKKRIRKNYSLGTSLAGSVIDLNLGLFQDLYNKTLGSDPNYKPNFTATANNTSSYAGGGMVDVSLDDGEVVETPDGNIQNVQGNPNQVDGVDTRVPEGSKVYSDILGIAEKKKALERERATAIGKLAKGRKRRPGDLINKQAVKKIDSYFDILDEQLMMEQEQLKNMLGLGENQQQNNPGFAAGTSFVDDEPPYRPYPSYGILSDGRLAPPPPGYGVSSTSTPNNSQEDSQEDFQQEYNPLNYMPTQGDKIGIAGSLISGVSGLATTITNKLATPNPVNHFENIGENALNNIRNTKGLAYQDYLDDKMDINESTNAANSYAAKHTRSLATNRALRLVSDENKRKGYTEAKKALNQRMSQLETLEANTSFQKDVYKAQGASARDATKAANIDNFHSQLGESIQNLGLTGQKIGQVLNTGEQQTAMLNLSNQFYDMQVGYDENGNLIFKNPGSGEESVDNNTEQDYYTMNKRERRKMDRKYKTRDNIRQGEVEMDALFDENGNYIGEEDELALGGKVKKKRFKKRRK